MYITILIYAPPHPQRLISLSSQLPSIAGGAK